MADQEQSEGMSAAHPELRKENPQSDANVAQVLIKYNRQTKSFQMSHSAENAVELLGALQLAISTVTCEQAAKQFQACLTRTAAELKAGGLSLPQGLVAPSGEPDKS